MDTYFVYVLWSVDYKRTYIGFSKNLEQRLKDHNAGRNKSTKPYRPWTMLYYESFESKKKALEREKFLKSGQGRDYIKKYKAISNL